MLELSEALNVYTDGVKTYRRVTSILAEVFPNEYDGISEATLDNAADRGREVELLAVQLLRDGYVDAECRADVVPRLQALDRWRKKHDVQYLGHQITVFSDKQGVAGTIDFELIVDGLITIVDLKCCANKQRTWRPQIGGYASMRRCDQAGILQLYPSLNQQGFRWYPSEADEVICYWNAIFDFWKVRQQL